MLIQVGELTLHIVFNVDIGGIEVAPLYFIVGRHAGSIKKTKKTRSKRSRRKDK